MSQRNINRRTFLLGTAGLAFSTAFLGGCSNAQSTSQSAEANSSDDASGGTAESATTSASTSNSVSSAPATVYFTRDISPAGLVAVYDALGFTPSGNVAVKLSTGEPGGHNFLQPKLIADLVQGVNGTIVECNLASLDPVALDRACVDLVYDAPDGLHIFDDATAIGLGTTDYELVEV